MQETNKKSASLWRWLNDHLEKTLMIGFYGYFCIIIFAEVVLRYVFSNSTPWGEMTARYAFVYLASIAIAEAAKDRSHIRIDILPVRLSPRNRLLLFIYFDLLQVLLGVLVVYYSLKVIGIQRASGQLMQSLDINMSIAYLALPLGWALFIFRITQRLAIDMKSYFSKGEVHLGGEGFSP